MCLALLLSSSRITAFSPSFRRHSSFLSRPRHLASVAVQQEDTNSTTSDSPTAAEPPLLYDPSQLFNNTIPYPKSLSPSSIMEFKKCPQSFLFQYLYNIKQPTSLVLLKGSMCHEALEKIFDLEENDRTLEHLQNLFRQCWSQHRQEEQYRHLFTTDSNNSWNTELEKQWGQESLQLLENYVRVEDPRTVTRPNPIQREIWVRADLAVDPRKGVTGYTFRGGSQQHEDSTDHNATFHVRGIVDRLDMIRIHNNHEQVALRIVDYKTGKAPNFKYSPAMNEKIATEAFYQLKIYALLMREKQQNNNNNLNIRMLRLLHLTSENSIQGQYLDMDLGETQEERDAVLQQVHADLSHVWTKICELVATQDPKAFIGCDRSFCYCHKCRAQFVPGTVWEP